jgi:hypothetical protein
MSSSSRAAPPRGTPPRRSPPPDDMGAGVWGRGAGGERRRGRGAPAGVAATSLLPPHSRRRAAHRDACAQAVPGAALRGRGRTGTGERTGPGTLHAAAVAAAASAAPPLRRAPRAVACDRIGRAARRAGVQVRQEGAGSDRDSAAAVADTSLPPPSLAGASCSNCPAKHWPATPGPAWTRPSSRPSPPTWPSRRARASRSPSSSAGETTSAALTRPAWTGRRAIMWACWPRS